MDEPEQEPVGSFLTREQAIEFCLRRRPSIEPTEQHIDRTIDAYAALFGDLVPTPPAAAQRPWVWLSTADEQEIKDRCTTVACVLRAVKAKLKEKNT